MGEGGVILEETSRYSQDLEEKGYPQCKCLHFLWVKWRSKVKIFRLLEHVGGGWGGATEE